MGRIHVLVVFLLFFISHEEYCYCSRITNTSCIEIERDSLLKFKNDVIDRSNRLSSWVGTDCCTWYGVACSKSTGRVIKLHLGNPDDHIADYYLNNSLGGEVNPSLQYLKHLNYLDLSMNKFSGHIPKFFGSFKNLMYLNLAYSGFSGEIPPHLGNLSSLQYLDLSSTISFSPLPTSDWLLALNMLPSLKVLNLAYCFITIFPPYSNVSFTSLASLDLSFNLIGPTIPLWLSNITSLEYLHIQANHFYGPVPGFLGTLYLISLDISKNSFNSSIPASFFNSSSLVHLDISENEFQGSLAMLIGNNLKQQSKLKELYMSSNQICGSIPTSLGKLSKLEKLDMSYNQLNGSLPSSLGQLSNLEKLAINSNKISGSIPISIGQLSKLEMLVISSNQLSKSIPTSLGQLLKLQILKINDNKLSGIIPRCLGQLSKLKELSISDNNLSGSIPVNLSQLSRLEILSIANNSLHGTLSEKFFSNLKMLEVFEMSSTSLAFNVSLQWTPPFQLIVLDIGSCNNIGPKFPQWLQTQTQIESLSIMNSSISDSIPDWFENIISRAHDIDLSNNQIKGKLPRLPVTLHVLLLSNNSLTGGIPTNLCTGGSLEYLDLSNNKFSGRLPSCLGSLVNLEVLDLTNNRLHGNLPSSLGSLSFLTSLHLHNNKFEGNIPFSFQNLTRLETFALGVNSFTGIIPPWIGEKLSELKRLSLRSNRFDGEIPVQICHLSSLKLLDLSNNRLTGNIPHCIGNLTSMIVNADDDGDLIYYIENIFASVKGTMRQYTKTVVFLKSIDVSNNNIGGQIPEGMVDLLGLNQLNLSGNQLNGRIPNRIGELKQLETLDLSRNKLSGPIPQSLSLINSLNHLNLSFNELSGRVPTGQQLQTLDDPTIYQGNRGLCGAPGLKSCSDNDKPPPAYESEASHESDRLWFYAGIGPGFLVGFLGFCATLHFNDSFRHAHFQFFENVINWLALAIALKIAWLKRKFHTNQL